MSLLPAKNQFTVWKGGTWRKILTLYTGDDTSSPKRDLTDYTGRMQVIDFDTSAELIDMTTANGGVTLGGTDGTIELYISDEDTEAATWEAGKYQLTITSAAGDTDPILYGTITIKSG
jgi:hypothetical protein